MQAVRWKHLLRVAAMSGLFGAGVAVGQSAADSVTPLHVEGHQFLLNGKPFQILSGELEYSRIPRADWRDRLRKVHAMGLNTITIYVFWDLHEIKPGTYDFAGQKDVAEFVREAQQEGLYVVLRPGPYVCAEWDLGGYPSWLLKDPAMVLRSSQPAYLLAARRWMLRLGKELAPLQASHGGPILAVQVENEYGSFDVQEDRQRYLKEVRQMVLDAGFGESLLYTADGGDELPKGSIPGLVAGVDYGTGDAARSLAMLKKFRPDGPVYAAEYWDGWFDHWGEKYQVTDAAVQEAEIRLVIASGGSISLYMVHGGTTFGWMNGANSGAEGYQPDVSSYDYDAPIDEAGRLRPKYFALREMIAEVTHRTLPPVPASPPMITFPAVELTASRSLLSDLKGTVYTDSPVTMEELDQAYGYILYRTEVPAGAAGMGKLSFEALHSYARVYLDGRLAGVVDRRLGQKDLTIDARAGQRLDILVENSGRVNFTTQIRRERAGVLGDVKLKGVVLHGWDVTPMPFNDLSMDGYSQQGCVGPCFYRGELMIKMPGDTFMNTAALGKGVIWVNGHLLGRFWNVGPMGSLFLPGAWLHAGANQITILDLNGGASVTVRGDDHPTYLLSATERSRPNADGDPSR
jgi:beta-galactosidase